MSKDNEMFIRYFDYYKKHPDKFKTIEEGFLPKVIVTFGIIFVFLVFTVGQLSSFSENLYWLSSLLFLSAITMFVVALYIEGCNNKYSMFCDMTYVGSASDLFGDLAAPEMKSHLNELVNDFDDYAGIKGYTAYNIHSKLLKEERKQKELNSNRYKQEMEKERIAKEIIINSVQEIKNIQNKV
jgi:hypothetical protein